MAKQIWTGRVDSSEELPINTGLNFKAGSPITIVSSGWARCNGDAYMRGPSGAYNTFRSDAKAPGEVIGALLVKTGESFKALDGGLIGWKVPTDDNIEFVYNDRRHMYHDNSGSFDVTIEYDDTDLLK